MRQIVLDTETTGLSTGHGHRIIEIGCLELVDRRLTGREFHRFLNPERDIDEGAERVHGITEWMDNWKRRGWKTAARKPVKNQDLWQALDEAIARHDIEWKWVKGHDGNPGNEEADALANLGIDEL